MCHRSRVRAQTCSVVNKIHGSVKKFNEFSFKKKKKKKNFCIKTKVTIKKVSLYLSALKKKKKKKKKKNEVENLLGAEEVKFSEMI